MAVDNGAAKPMGVLGGGPEEKGASTAFVRVSVPSVCDMSQVPTVILWLGMLC